MFNNRCIYW